MNGLPEAVQADLVYLYGADLTARVGPRLSRLIDEFRIRNPELDKRGMAGGERLSHQDAVLITYGDQIQEGDLPALQVLGQVLDHLCADILPCVHILPFYPYSSDDGFSVVDYREVNPLWGDWEDVEALGRRFRLMFDAVINHISQKSAWFEAFKRGEAPYTDYFISVDPHEDLSEVVRPRTLPLLTPVETADGPRHVWTTFSADQIDLNFGSVDLLLDVIEVLLFYVERGAQLIRLDAIGFLWKELGTSCIHLPQTHRVIQLMRAILDEVAPEVVLVTETNVPHAENVSYFGDGSNEAQMVYNFTLPPLTLHAFLSEDASHLSEWAATLETPSEGTTFFNFMASHDGIGLRPLEGILPAEQVERLARRVLDHGGLVSYRTNADGSRSPYELNVVYFDALNRPNSDEPQSLQVARFMASQAVLLSMKGVPGVYVHSLFGSRNWPEGVALTGENRTVNRRKFLRRDLEESLADPASIPHQVFERFRQLLRVRIAEPAFHPAGEQEVLIIDPVLFAFLRIAPGGGARVLCIHNVSSRTCAVALDLSIFGEIVGDEIVDLAHGSTLNARSGRLKLTVSPYAIHWLKLQ